MSSFLFTWKEMIFFAGTLVFLFTPWSRRIKKYILLCLVIYILNRPLIANFHPGDMDWWLGDPAAWISAVTWVGGPATAFRWFKGIKSHGVWNALSEVSWHSHLIALSLVLLTMFLFHLPAISPQFKTRPDFSFPLVILHVPVQYFIGVYLLKSYRESIRHPITIALIGVLFFVLAVSFWQLQCGK